MVIDKKRLWKSRKGWFYISIFGPIYVFHVDFGRVSFAVERSRKYMYQRSKENKAKRDALMKR